MGRSPQGEDHEAGIEAHARRLYELGFGYDIDADETARASMLDVSRRAVAAYLSRCPSPEPYCPLHSDAEHPDWQDYVATNLLDALSQVADTGDWHGALRAWCKRHSSGRLTPNRSPSPERNTEKLVEALREIRQWCSDGKDAIQPRNVLGQIAAVADEALAEFSSTTKEKG